MAENIRPESLSLITTSTKAAINERIAEASIRMAEIARSGDAHTTYVAVRRDSSRQAQVAIRSLVIHEYGPVKDVKHMMKEAVAIEFGLTIGLGLALSAIKRPEQKTRLDVEFCEDLTHLDTLLHRSKPSVSTKLADVLKEGGSDFARRLQSFTPDALFDAYPTDIESNQRYCDALGYAAMTAEVELTKQAIFDQFPNKDAYRELSEEAKVLSELSGLTTEWFET